MKNIVLVGTMIIVMEEMRQFTCEMKEYSQAKGNYNLEIASGHLMEASVFIHKILSSGVKLEAEEIINLSKLEFYIDMLYMGVQYKIGDGLEKVSESMSRNDFVLHNLERACEILKNFKETTDSKVKVKEEIVNNM